MTPEPQADHEYEVDVLGVAVGTVAAVDVLKVAVGVIEDVSAFVPPVGRRYLPITATTSSAAAVAVVEAGPLPPPIVAVERPKSERL